jgi:hypothetical protein
LINLVAEGFAISGRQAFDFSGLSFLGFCESSCDQFCAAQILRIACAINKLDGA